MKTPRTFRNDLYEFLVSRDVTEETAKSIAGEAELYVEAYEQYKLRDITFAAQSMGMDVKKTARYEAFLELRKKIEALISDQVREELTNLKIARLNLDKITTDHADGYQMAIDDMNRHIDNRIKELEESK